MRPLLRRDHMPVLAGPDRDVRGDEHASHNVVNGGGRAGQDVLDAVLAERRLGVLGDVTHGDGLLKKVRDFLYFQLGKRTDEGTHRTRRGGQPTRARSL